jgi:uncharacterized protein YqeY
MENLADQIQREMAHAAKARDKLRLSALRMIRSAIQNREIEKRAPLTDDEVVQTISSLSKRSKESIEQFRLGNREDLVEKEEAELQVILSFMPEQLSEEKIAEELASIIQEVGAKEQKDLGVVMKTAMTRLAGRADGRLVQQLAREILSSQNA